MNVHALYFDTQILNIFAECQEYKEHWDWEFCKSQIKYVYGLVANHVDNTSLKNVNKELKLKSISSEFEYDLNSGYMDVKRLLRTIETSKDDNRSKLKVELDKIKEKYTAEGNFTLQNFKSMDINRLKEFGFKSWDDNLILFPLWMSFILPNDFEVIGIMGDTSTICNCDKDVRFGCIAYGFNI